MKFKTLGKVIIFISLLSIFFIYFNISKNILPNLDISTDDIYSKNAILISLDTKEDVYVKNSTQRIAPASLTKIMTAIIVLENCQNLNQSVIVSNSTIQAMLVNNASTAGFEANESTTIKDLLYGLLLSSGGECGLTLANSVAGDEISFVALMNQKAKDLGLTNTHYMNVNGFDEENHYASVKDIANVLCYALNNPTFKEIFTTSDYISSPTRFHPDGIFMQSTVLKSDVSLSISNGNLLGGKTGYTKNAGLCLASYAKINGKEYIFVSTKADGDHNTSPYHILDALHMYEDIS